MTISELSRAQRWHETDHGRLRELAVRKPADRAVRPVSACWCCCDWCDPHDSERPNPFWSAAMAHR